MYTFPSPISEEASTVICCSCPAFNVVPSSGVILLILSLSSVGVCVGVTVGVLDTVGVAVAPPFGFSVDHFPSTYQYSPAFLSVTSSVNFCPFESQIIKPMQELSMAL